jgi:hypothetical protein
MLGAAGYRVISEAPPIDQAIVENLPELRAVIQAFGGPQPYVVKLDAWHIHSMALIRETFPETPWMFLFRNPVEVLVSLMRSPGRHALPGALDPGMLGMARQDITLRRGEWAARVLAAICRSALRDRGGLFVDYCQLPEAVWDSVAPNFGLHLTEDQIARMQDAARFDAKHPAATFASDTLQKQTSGQEFGALIRATELDALYSQLTSARLRQGAG